MDYTIAPKPVTGYNMLMEKRCQWCKKSFIANRKERKFCGIPCATKNMNLLRGDRTGANNPSWKGGVRLSAGYRFIQSKNHPKADRKGYVQEHRLVMEDYLGRYLRDGETVHHLNYIKDDNRVENLELCATQAEHIRRYHPHLGKRGRNGWLRKRTPIPCLVCGTDFLPNAPKGKFCKPCVEKHGWRIYNRLDEIL